MKRVGPKGCASRNVGSNNANAKLKNKDIIAIRRSKLPLRKLAAKYNISKSAAWLIAACLTWTHVPGKRVARMRASRKRAKR